MAVVENRSTEVGDVIYIKAEIPIVGLIALSTFMDTTQNETADRSFKKEFRFSVDGLTFSPWQILNNPNLSAVELAATDTVYLEYKYSRQGVDATGELVFENVTLQGEFLEQLCGIAYNRSVFSDYFKCFDVQVLTWAINVLQKLYAEGIIPKYIERAKDDDQGSDQDYVAFWKPITIFYAYLVIFARVFENFTSNEKLSNLYINEKGLYTCGDEGLDQLLFIIVNQLRERSHRGSIAMYQPAQPDTVDGELLRLICWKNNDEFLFGVAQSKKVGWNLGNNSPMYRGLTGRYDLNKSYEYSEDIEDLSKYPLVGEPYISLATDGDMQVMKIDGVPDGESAGIGNADFALSFPVDTDLNYEITFFVKQEILAQNLTFGALAFDEAGGFIPLINLKTQIASNFFFKKVQLNRDDTYYLVRGIIYNKNQTPLNTTPNVGTGNYLRFSPNIVRIVPYIVLDNEVGGVGGPMDIWNVKVTPVRTLYSRGFLNNKNFKDLFVKNRNGRIDVVKLRSILREFFINYNTSFGVTNLEQVGTSFRV